MQIRHHLIDAASRNNHIDLIHVSRGSLDCLQESASGFPDGFLTLLGIGNQHVQCALFQAEFGHLVIRFFDLHDDVHFVERVKFEFVKCGFGGDVKVFALAFAEDLFQFFQRGHTFLSPFSLIFISMYG